MNTQRCIYKVNDIINIAKSCVIISISVFNSFVSCRKNSFKKILTLISKWPSLFFFSLNLFGLLQSYKKDIYFIYFVIIEINGCFLIYRLHKRHRLLIFIMTFKNDENKEGQSNDVVFVFFFFLNFFFWRCIHAFCMKSFKFILGKNPIQNPKQNE